VILGNADLDRVSRPELALQDLLRQRVFDLLLDRPLERPRPIHRIESSLSKLLPGRVRQDDRHLALRQPFMQIPELDVDDRANMLLAQRMENDHVIDPVDELRPELLRNDFHYRGLHRIVIILARQFLDALRS